MEEDEDGPAGILVKVSSSKSVKEVKVKCLKILGAIKVLPPPGGPIAVTKVESINFLKGF